MVDDGTGKPAAPEELLEEIVHLSHRWGGNGLWILKGGGNSSVKNDRYLWVKASGTSLGTIRPNQFVRMKRHALDAIWEKDYPEDSAAREEEAKADLLAARDTGEEEKRPSVESLMHGFFPQRIVLHSHATIVNALTCAVGGEAAAREIFRDDLLWIPTVNPGYILARRLHDEVESYRRVRRGRYPRIILLQNHGLVVCGETPDEITAIHGDIVDKVLAHLPEELQARYRLWDESADDPAVGLTVVAGKAVSGGADDGEATAKSGDTTADALNETACSVAALLVHYGSPLPAVVTDRASLFEPWIRSSETFAPLDGALTPDHIVYAGHKPLWIDTTDTVAIQEAIGTFREREGVNPRIVALKGLGIMAVESTLGKAESAALLFRDGVKITTLAAAFGGARFMPTNQIDFIRNWEVEAFRQSVGN